MGFEIKHICTIVPNPYHPVVNDDNGNYHYFSLFITPRLQFDGTLKEFYEMLHWPEYAEQIFWNWSNGELGSLTGEELRNCRIIVDDKPVKIQKDYSLLHPILTGMDIIASSSNEVTREHIKEFLEKSRKTWRKLFHETVPVEAWPIYLKPQIDPYSNELEEEIKKKAQRITAILDSMPVRPPNVDPPYNGLGEGGDRRRRTDEQPTEAGRRLKQEQAELEILVKHAEELRNKRGREKFEKTKFREEFHKKMSALARYPHILRILGLIQDFKVAKTSLIGLKLSDILIRLSVNRGVKEIKKQYPFTEFFKSVQFLCPYTRCEIVDGRMRSHFITPLNSTDLEMYGDTTPDYYKYVTGGFLVNNVFTVDQEYFEEKPAEIPKTGQAGNVVGMNGKTFREDELEILRQKLGGSPAISKGFSIRVHDQPGDILVSMAGHFKTITDENIESKKSAFMAHHLDCGYRVDVSVDGQPFRSLCRREATYLVDYLEDNRLLDLFERKKLISKLEDEPWLEEVRQMDREGNEDRFEEIARWVGWSLSCPPLYRNKSAPNSEGDDMELEDIKPLELPKLRFGKQYRFRIRTVDICGNGPRLKDDCDENKCVSPNPEHHKKGITYLRKEQIAPPLLFPLNDLVDNLDSDNNAEKSIHTEFKGEDEVTLVVRSLVSKELDKVQFLKPCIRFVTPQYINPAFAEALGQFELFTDGGLYDFIKEIPCSSYKEEDIKNKIPFAVDTFVDGIHVSVKKKNVTEKKGVKGFQFVKNMNKGNPARQPIRLSLDETALTGLTPAIGLTRGNCLTLLVQSVMTKVVPGLTSKSVSKSVRLIHAVQRPVYENRQPVLNSVEIDGRKLITSLGTGFRFEKLVPQSGSYKDEQKYQVMLDKRALVTSNLRFPFSTAGEIIIHAAYQEFVLDPLKEDGWSYVDKFHIRKSWSNLDEETEEDHLDTLLTNTLDIGVLDKEFDFFRHSFPDTRYRKVTYTLEAISKFSEFFDAEAHGIDKKDNSPFSTFATLDARQSDGTHYTIIKNSARPSRPSIHSIVPVFTATDPEKRNGYTYSFTHSTYRLYLGNTWYETGLDEKIAIIHEKTADTLLYDDANGDPKITVAPGSPPDSTYLKNKISVFANDPADSLNGVQDSIKNIKDNFLDSLALDSSYIREDLLHVRADSLHIRSDSTDLHPRPAAIQPDSGHIYGDSARMVNTMLFENSIEQPNVNGVMRPKGHAFSVFDVRWDAKEQQFYCDIKLNLQAFKAYSYLLKFAVCRYQEHSISLENQYDYRFSDVVMTDMVRSFPERSIVFRENTLKISGTEGILFSEKNKVRSFRKNKWYLVQELKQEVNKEVYPAMTSNAQVVKDGIVIGTEVDLSGLKGTFFIEEYEDRVLNDDFVMDERSPTYNPRQDPQKKLTFFFKFHR